MYLHTLMCVCVCTCSFRIYILFALKVKNGVYLIPMYSKIKWYVITSLYDLGKSVVVTPPDSEYVTGLIKHVSTSFPQRINCTISRTKLTVIISSLHSTIFYIYIYKRK